MFGQQPQTTYGALPPTQTYTYNPSGLAAQPPQHSQPAYNNPPPQQQYDPQQSQQYTYNTVPSNAPSVMTDGHMGTDYSMKGGGSYQDNAYGMVGGDSNGHYGASEQFTETGEKFAEMNEWRDKGFFFFWLLHFVLVAVIFVAGAITATSGAGNEETTDEVKPLPDAINRGVVSHFLLIVAMCTVLAVAIGWFWVFIVQKFAKYLIKIGIVFSVILFFSFAALSFSFGSIFTGIIMAIFGVFMIFLYYTWRKRIKFATKMLILAGHLIEQYPATVRFGYLAMILQFFWLALWAVTLGLANQYTPWLANVCTLYLVFSLYWTSQIIKNVVHVTTGGTVATWYFMYGGVGMPHNPTIKAFKRATTTSLGSVCFGSLIIAVLRTMRFMADCLRHSGSSDDGGSIVAVILGFMCSCILGFIESLLEYFNQYAFAQVAIYGKPYVQAAKDTWALVHSHGMEAIINDNLVGNVLGMICVVSGAATGTVGALLGLSFENELGGDYWVLLFIVGFFVGFVVVMTVTEVVESTVVTIFVCFAEDPEVLRTNSPQIYKTLNKAYQHGSV